MLIYILSLALSFAVSIMLAWHLYLISRGESTVENYDFARYREMSSHDNDAGTSTNKGAKAKHDFSRACAFYEQSRLILPDQGQPSNQLAVVSLYSTDTFAALYYYYRALCVKTPFAKARELSSTTRDQTSQARMDNGTMVKKSAAVIWAGLVQPRPSVRWL